MFAGRPWGGPYAFPQATLETLAKEAHEKICPYSHATRGNVDVTLTVKGG